MCDIKVKHYCNKSASTYRKSENSIENERLVPPFSAQSLQKGTKVIDYQTYVKSKNTKKKTFFSFLSNFFLIIFIGFFRKSKTTF